MNIDEAREQQIKDQAEKSFEMFLRMPTTRLIISTLPPMQDPDALNVLLRAAFDTGHATGSGSIALALLENIFKDRKE
jgi:hypothetical protein